MGCLTYCCLESVFASWTPHLQYLLCKNKMLTDSGVAFFQAWDDEIATNTLKWQMIYSTEQRCAWWHFRKISSWWLCINSHPCEYFKMKHQTTNWNKRPCGIKLADTDETHVHVLCGELLLPITVPALLLRSLPGRCWAAAPGSCSPLSPGEAASPCAWSEETDPRPWLAPDGKECRGLCWMVLCIGWRWIYTL